MFLEDYGIHLELGLWTPIPNGRRLGDGRKEYHILTSYEDIPHYFLSEVSRLSSRKNNEPFLYISHWMGNTHCTPTFKPLFNQDEINRRYANRGKRGFPTQTTTIKHLFEHWEVF